VGIKEVDKAVLRAAFIAVPVAIVLALIEGWYVLGTEQYEICKATYDDSDGQTHQGGNLVGVLGLWLRFWYLLSCHHYSFLSLFSILLVGATLWLAWVTRGLWQATVEIHHDARETAKLELRAYIGFRELVIRVLPNGRFQIQAVIENSGRTPANDVRFFWDYNVHASGYNGPFPVSEAATSAPLMPTAQRSIRAVISRDRLRTEDHHRIAQDLEIFVWGKIKFRDIYRIEQTVDFRFHTREVITTTVVDESGTPQTSLAGWALQPTREGNEAS
jgi:hypothetical protein